MFQINELLKNLVFRKPLQTIEEAVSVLQEEAAEDEDDGSGNEAGSTSEDVSSVSSVSDVPEELTGKITHVDEHYAVIDLKYHVESPSPDLKQDMKVKFKACLKDGRWEITDVKPLEENKKTEKVTKDHFKNYIRTQVKKREDRVLYCEPGELIINLDTVQTEFIPMEGDWIKVLRVSDIDEEMTAIANSADTIIIQPFKLKLVAGMTVTEWDEKTLKGKVRDDIYINKDVCLPGFMPVIGDKVSVTYIESEPEENCIYRAIRVEPHLSKEKQKTLTELPNKEDFKILENKSGIMVDDIEPVRMDDLEKETTVSVAIHNTSTQARRLIRGKFKNSLEQSQLVLKTDLTDMVIGVQETRMIHFTCTSKFMGMTREMFIFDFEEFQIGRWFEIIVKPKYDAPKARGYSYRNKQAMFRVARNSRQYDNKFVLLGEKPIRPPSFIANKLPMYEVPRKIYDSLFESLEKCPHVNNLNPEEVAPCLNKKLVMYNYEEKFHTLLYLEEISLQINMHKYDIERARFFPKDGFLSLEVKDLIERRPSIIVGDRLIATELGNPEGAKYEGFVHKTTQKQVLVKFNPTFHTSYKGEEYQVEFRSSRTNFRRYHFAVDLASRHLGEDILFPNRVRPKKSQVDFVEVDEHSPSKNNLGKTQNYRELVRQIKPIYNTNVLTWHDPKLNHFQKQAVRNILRGEARPLPYLVFGPPGTGKTVTLIEGILQIVKMMPESRLLVVAPSNSAADLLALRLLESRALLPGEMVRMVAYRCVTDGLIPEKLIPYCVTCDIAREGSREKKTCLQNGVSVGVQASELGQHRITVSTCVVAGNLYTMGFKKDHFSHIIVDEAGQATEPELMIPLVMLDPKTSQVILAGDPLQLGPVVFSQLAEITGLAESYFDRLINRFPYIRDPVGFTETGGYDPRLVTRLVYNYRSLPEILDLPNTLFYDSELRPTISGEAGGEVNMLVKLEEMLPVRNPVPPSFIFHGVRGENHKSPDSPSWYNPTEAFQVFSYIRSLYRFGIRPHDIGVITPYIKQGQHVRSMLFEAKMDLPKVGSVEEFQGQEFKVIVLSTVRSNEYGAKMDAMYGLGFLASPRRLNVAITRAMALLIIVGNPHLLVTDAYWRSVITYAMRVGGYRGCDPPSELL